MKHVIIDKRIGQTPLQAIQEWKAAHPDIQDVPATYAGRLDPMAEGLLLVLLGEECKKKDAYVGLDKEYEVEVLLGVGSDTGDVLGIVHAGTASESFSTLPEILRNEVGAHMRPYPVFSSKPVDGKPLFLHALEGTLGTISIPEHLETIHRIIEHGTKHLDTATLQTRIEGMLASAPISDEPSKVLGADFRINAVRASWNKVFASSTIYHVIKLTVTCGSGAYMRTLAQRIGTALGTEALALSIRRTRIGTWHSIGSIGFLTNQYKMK